MLATPGWVHRSTPLLAAALALMPASGHPQEPCPNQECAELAAPGNGDAMLANAKAFAAKDDAGNALSWFGRAAKDGNQEALATLAFLLTEEFWEYRDLDRAAAILGQARRQGRARADFLMGQLYETYGERKKIDGWQRKAAAYYSQAVDAGSPDAAAALAKLQP